MQSDSVPAARSSVLPLILIAAAAQGWALYALHWALENKTWPASDSGWLFACYAIAVFVPLTAQFFASYARISIAWMMMGALCLGFGYLAWHQGSWVQGANATEAIYFNPECAVVTGFVLGLIWLMSLPFLQVRLTTARWRPEYPTLFSMAWRNKLMLAEAALFTGLFWILLALWQELFRMLGMTFFRELFSKPIFIYPVTSVVFGIALHLIGSVERLTSVLLEQLLNVLKWLAIVAGVLLVVFTLSLIVKLPAMISSQNRPISAAWLLWLLACLVLLINAAYRDGTIAQPYPRWVAVGLRCAIPLTVVIALTALYAIGIRISRYGITVERMWACVVALGALAYAIGYSLAARAKGAWMRDVGRVNVCVALALIGVLMLALTPVLSPYRIAAASQFRIATANAVSNAQSGANDALRYLRFDAGRYGLQRLRELAQKKTGEVDSETVAAAQRMLALKQPWDGEVRSTQHVLEKLIVYPTGSSIDSALLQTLRDDLASPTAPRAHAVNPTEPPLGLFIDMNGDDVREFVLVGINQSLVYQKQGDAWQYVGVLLAVDYSQRLDVVAQIQSGHFSAEPPQWRELCIGDKRFRVQGTP